MNHAAGPERGLGRKVVSRRGSGIAAIDRDVALIAQINCGVPIRSPVGSLQDRACIEIDDDGICLGARLRNVQSGPACGLVDDAANPSNVTGTKRR